MATVTEDELAQLTAEHLSDATLRFLRAVQNGDARIGGGVWGSRWFTCADWTDVDDLTHDELLDESGDVTAWGVRVLDAEQVMDAKRNEDGCNG